MRMTVAACAALLATSAIAAGVAEHWIAVSTTAMGITGDITLSPTRLTMAGKTLPLRVAADTPSFGTDSGSVAARVLRVVSPADPVLLHGNHLCGGTPARWIVVWRQHAFGQSNLGMAVFSGPRQPAGENDPSLCGTFLFSTP